MSLHNSPNPAKNHPLNSNNALYNIHITPPQISLTTQTKPSYPNASPLPTSTNKLRQTTVPSPPVTIPLTTSPIAQLPPCPHHLRPLKTYLPMKDPEAQHPFHPRCATPNTLSKIPISSESHAAGVKVKVLFVSRCIRQLTIEAAGSTFTAAAKITVNNTNTANVKMTGQRQSPVSVAVKRESVVYIVLCYYLLFFAISGK